jgi:hypothetical protein
LFFNSLKRIQSAKNQIGTVHAAKSDSPMKKLPQTKVAAGFLALILAVPAFGALPSLSYGGSTAGQPVWNRPLANQGNPPNTLSGVGTAVPFLAQPFYADQSGSYSFTSDALSPVKWDNFSFLYAGSFNPAAPLANVLIGNDDLPAGNIGVSGFNYNLNANSPYVLVITGFSNEDFGSFTNTISGPGNVRLGSNARVPEAGSILPAFAIVLAGLGFCQRLGKRS